MASSLNLYLIVRLKFKGTQNLFQREKKIRSLGTIQSVNSVNNDNGKIDMRANFRSDGIGKSGIVYMHLYPNR